MIEFVGFIILSPEKAKGLTCVAARSRTAQVAEKGHLSGFGEVFPGDCAQRVERSNRSSVFAGKGAWLVDKYSPDVRPEIILREWAASLLTQGGGVCHASCTRLTFAGGSRGWIKGLFQAGNGTVV